MGNQSAPLIYNKTCTLADTEYSQALSPFCKSFAIKARAFADLKIAFIAAASGGTYWTIPGSSSENEFGGFNGTVTVYFQSPTAGTVVEILEKN